MLRFALSFFSHSVYRWCFFDAGLCILTGVLGVLSICYSLFEFYVCIFGVLGASPSCQISFLDLILFARKRCKFALWVIMFLVGVTPQAHRKGCTGCVAFF